MTSNDKSFEHILSVRYVHYDEETGWLTVGHDGNVTWDELQRVKNEVMGEDALAIEVYPPTGTGVNKAVERHLWKMPLDAVIPNLMDIQIMGVRETKPYLIPE